VHFARPFRDCLSSSCWVQKAPFAAILHLFFNAEHHSALKNKTRLSPKSALLNSSRFTQTASYNLTMKNSLFFCLGCLLLVRCSLDQSIELPTTPVFQVDAVFGDTTRVQLAGGINDYYMFTDCAGCRATQAIAPIL
jgi:hypothetical protein